MNPSTLLIAALLGALVSDVLLSVLLADGWMVIVVLALLIAQNVMLLAACIALYDVERIARNFTPRTSSRTGFSSGYDGDLPPMSGGPM